MRGWWFRSIFLLVFIIILLQIVQAAPWSLCADSEIGYSYCANNHKLNTCVYGSFWNNWESTQCIGGSECVVSSLIQASCVCPSATQSICQGGSKAICCNNQLSANSEYCVLSSGNPSCAKSVKINVNAFASGVGQPTPGGITGNGIFCSANPTGGSGICNSIAQKGSTVTLTASWSDGFKISWPGGSGHTYIFVANTDNTVTATFIPTQCNDGLDNDGDGKKDLVDSGCYGDKIRDSELCHPGEDPDSDGVCNDGVPPDNCPDYPNSDQGDTDTDGIGNACEPIIVKFFKSGSGSGTISGPGIDCGSDCDAIFVYTEPPLVVSFAVVADMGSKILSMLCDLVQIMPGQKMGWCGILLDSDSSPSILFGKTNCNDGYSNFDGDDLIDYPSDLGCSNIDDDDERCNNGGQDNDLDSVCDEIDNCNPLAFCSVNYLLCANQDQSDTDTDGIGNACDNCPSDSNPFQADADGDSYGDVCDNCPSVANTDQADTDGDGIGNACEVCLPVTIGLGSPAPSPPVEEKCSIDFKIPFFDKRIKLFCKVIALSPEPAVLPDCTVGLFCSHTFVAMSGTPSQPISATYTSSASIPGLTFSGNTLSGTPTEWGDYAFSVTATEIGSTCPAGSQSFTLKVKVLTYSLSISFSGNGQVVVGWLDMWGDPYTGTFNSPSGGTIALLLPNTIVNLAADADTGWIFDHWSGACSGSNSATSVTVNADLACTAVFRKTQCNDGIDNDDSEDILADTADPGCLSGPGGTYNINDDDESDNCGGLTITPTALSDATELQLYSVTFDLAGPAPSPPIEEKCFIDFSLFGKRIKLFCKNVEDSDKDVALSPPPIESCSIGGAPSNLGKSGVCTLSGTPDAGTAGTYPITVSITPDGCPALPSVTMDLTVNAAACPTDCSVCSSTIGVGISGVGPNPGGGVCFDCNAVNGPYNLTRSGCIWSGAYPVIGGQYLSCSGNEWKWGSSGALFATSLGPNTNGCPNTGSYTITNGDICIPNPPWEPPAPVACTSGTLTI